MSHGSAYRRPDRVFPAAWPLLLPVAVAVAVVRGGPVRGADEAPRRADAGVEAQMQQQLRQQAQHWEQQFTKLLYGELELIRAVCGDLSEASRRAVRQAGERAVREAAERLAENQMGRRLNNVRAAEPRRAEGEKPRLPDGKPRPPVAIDPVALISRALAAAIAETAGAEPAAAYAAEVAARNERWQRAVVTELVSLLDEEIVLESRQRQEIARVLFEHWNDGMYLAVTGMYVANGRRGFPGLPLKQLLPMLTEPQRQRFKADATTVDFAGNTQTKQAWLQLHLNNIHAVARDPWWFP